MTTQGYLPLARVKLILRLEDFGAKDVPATPKKPPHLRRGKGPDNASELQVVRDGFGYVLRAPDEGTTAGGGPQDQTRSSDGRTFVVDDIVPANASLLRNGIRTADTLSVSVGFRDLPLDPRSLRSIGVCFYLGCVPQEDYARAAQGEILRCPDTFIDAEGRSRSNLRFQGFADEIELEFADGDEPLVRLECTDNTCLLIDQSAPAKLSIGADAPIDRAVADYLAAFPQFRGLRVEYRPPGAEPPALAKALAKTAYRPKLGPAPAGGAAGGGGGSDKLTVWDYLTDVAGSVGLIVRMEGTTVVLQRPRTLYSNRYSGRPDDPFRGRVLADGRRLDNRLYIYGENVYSPSFKRRFRRASATNVEVRCYSGRLGKTLVARYPGTSKDQRQAKLLPGNAADDKWHVFTVHGVEDEASLRAIAQGVYEQIGRSELAARFASQNLGSTGGGNLDPDALDCLAGDAIELEFARYAGGWTEELAEGASVASASAAYLRQRGFDAAFAEAYGRAMAHVGLTTTFRVKSLGIEWDAGGDGVSLDFEVQNYVEVRRDKDLPEGEEVATTGGGS